MRPNLECQTRHISLHSPRDVRIGHENAPCAVKEPCKSVAPFPDHWRTDRRTIFNADFANVQRRLSTVDSAPVDEVDARTDRHVIVNGDIVGNCRLLGRDSQEVAHFFLKIREMMNVNVNYPNLLQENDKTAQIAREVELRQIGCVAGDGIDDPDAVGAVRRGAAEKNRGAAVFEKGGEVLRVPLRAAAADVIYEQNGSFWLGPAGEAGDIERFPARPHGVRADEFTDLRQIAGMKRLDGLYRLAHAREFACAKRGPPMMANEDIWGENIAPSGAKRAAAKIIFLAIAGTEFFKVE